MRTSPQGSLSSSCRPEVVVQNVGGVMSQIAFIVAPRPAVHLCGSVESR